MSWMVEFDKEDKQAMESQIEAANKCILEQKDVSFVITDPVSKKTFNSMCKFVDDTNVIFVNQETNKERKSYYINHTKH
tara:strand:+ start:20197 stop:20433 length:237 start_codon:yes stop_codon:yes gene_type:complete